ncbi:copper transport protein [Rhodoligotrophos appendicifer]|uniref:copper resistance CopC/CopD family protein n=1 Tax=Rhodoligotrophos appendicifer TaxID=987056 RepID=UPI00117FD658|nr:CopD family protein [Rhodoligotrophos appendicifer]
MKAGGSTIRGTVLERLSLVLCVAVVMLATVVQGWAHAALRTSDPEAGAVLEQAPEFFTLSFSEPVSPLVLKLIDSRGASVTLDDVQASGNLLRARMPSDLSSGTHVLSWRVTSIDGHPVGGSVVFSIGSPSAGSGAGVMTAPPVALGMMIWSTKLVLYCALFFGIGGAFFGAWFAQTRRAGTKTIACLLAAGVFAVPISVCLQGLDSLAEPVSRLFTPTVWEAGLASSYGLTAVIAAAAFCIAGIGLAAKGSLQKLLAVAALTGLGLALAASGHASAAQPQPWMRLVVFLHGVTVAFWLGALLPLLLLLKAPAGHPLEALRKFSRAIPYVLLVLVCSGVTLIVIQVPRLGDIVETAYGQLLLAKLALLLAIFAIAGFNRWRLTHRTHIGDDDARRLLVKTIALETVLFLIVLGLVAGWRFTAPPRSQPVEVAHPVPSARAASAELYGDTAMAVVVLTPGQAGVVQATISVMTHVHLPLEAKEVALVLANPSIGIEKMRQQAVAEGDGVWRIDALRIPVPGLWKIQVEILVSDFDLVALEGSIMVSP